MSAQEVKDYVSFRLHRLSGMAEHPQKAMLANLRRGIGRAPGELPELWGIFLEDLPERLQSRNGEATRAEWAVYLALTLYALHQQGHPLPGENMYEKGISLGRAVRRLIPPEEDVAGSSVLRRFNALATAADIGEAAHHLRSMIQLLRAQGIPLDHAQLAADLYALQSPEMAPRVRLRWGQDFYRTIAPSQDQ